MMQATKTTANQGVAVVTLPPRPVNLDRDHPVNIAIPVGRRPLANKAR